MSIHFNTNNVIDATQRYVRSNDAHQSIRNETTADRTSADYDKVSIHGRDSGPDNADFAAVLAKKTAASVQKGVSENRIAELHDQVQSGNYHPDPERIAAHLLGYR
ncbi:MAG: flagellar biosynthesis anti-sigma factor FlgM [Eubacterium sp.]|nr:flagellar biosynthesis anti-sigma factor FlgM [Eubacterium sp.]